METTQLSILLSLAAALMVALWLRRRINRSAPHYQRLLRQAEEARARGDAASAHKQYARVAERLAANRNITPRLAALWGQSLLALAELDRDRGSLSQALERYREAMRLVEVSPDIVDLVATDYARREQLTPEAIAAYIHYIEQTPPTKIDRDTVWSFLRSVCEIEQRSAPDEIQTVLAVSRAVVEHAPAMDWAHFALGVVSDRLGNATQAVSSLRQAEQIAPTRAAIPYQLGLLHLNAGDTGQALDAFQRSLRLDPYQPDAYYQIASLLYASARESDNPELPVLTRAIALLHQGCRLAPARADLWFLLGQVQMARGRPDLARPAVSEALALAGDNEAYRQTLALLDAETSGGPTSLEALRRVVSADPTHLPAQLRLAGLLADEGRLEDAAVHYRRLLTLEPDLREAKLGLGRVLLRTEQWQDAIEHLSSADQLGRGDWLGLATAFEHVGRAAEAAGMYEDYLDGGEVDAEVCLRLAHLRARLGQWAEALTAFKQAEPELERQQLPLGEAALGKGIALLHLGRHDEAAASLDIAHEAGIDDIRLLYARALLALGSRDHELARRMLGAALQAERTFAPAYFALAVLEERENDWAAAANQYVRGLELAPDWPALRTRLAIAQARAGKWYSAIESFNAAGEHAAKSAEAAFYLGLAQAKLHRYAESLATWRALLASYPDRAVLTNNIAVVLYELGRQHFDTGDYDAAITHWEDLYKLRPDVEEFRDCLVEAYVRLGIGLLCSNSASGQTRIAGGLTLERALQLEPADHRPRYYLGLTALAAGNPDRALRHLQPLLDENPDEARFQYHTALALLGRGEAEPAAALLDRLWPPTAVYHPGLVVAKANAAHLLGRWDAAFEAYESVLAEALPAGKRE